MIHLPWIFAFLRVSGWAAFLLTLHYIFTGYAPQLSWWLLLGWVYIFTFKYFFHRGPMHKDHLEINWRQLGIHKKISLGLFAKILASHGSHHVNFCDDNFQRRDQLDDIVSIWWLFPALLTSHYLAFLALLPASATPNIILAISVWFALFEAVHWFTHVEGTWLDNTLSRTWGVGWLWVYTVEYHREHHQRPKHNFHFLPPWLLDWIFNTGLSPRIYRDSDGRYKAKSAN